MLPPPRTDSPRLDSQSAARLAVTAKPPEEEPERGLCCCEYVNMHGERSHAAVPCCDCEDLDEACDRWLKRQPQKPESVSRLLAAVSDRARIPWLWGGARKVDPSAIASLVLLPALLHVAALHFLLLAAVVFAALPGVLAWYYTRLRKKGRTRFFLSLTLCSVGYMCYVFVTEVCPRGDVGSARSAAFTAGMILGLLALAHTRKDPGAVRPSRGDVPDRTLTSSRNPSPETEVAFSGATVTKWADLRGSEQTTTGAERTERGGDSGGRKDWWCEACTAPRPPRAGHCRTCGVCVRRLDHHCVWIDSCVGQANHRSFLLMILLFLWTSLYGIGLSLRSVCPGRQSLLTALLYCPGVFQQHATALVFACAWYGSVVTAGLLCLLLAQVVNISHNVTLREAHVARTRESAKACIGCWGLVVDAGVHSRGLRRNWLEFMTMGDDLYVLPD